MADRILDKLDEYLGKNDYEGAKRHLNYWLNEAKLLMDKRRELLLSNELMGLHRKLGEGEQSLAFARRALELTDELDIADNIGAATTYINAATVYKAFGMAESSPRLFEKAEEIYLKNLPKNDERLGGLYNNMGLAYCDLKMFSKARQCYRSALDTMERVESGEGQCAITYLNLASCTEAEKGLLDGESEINSYIEKAMELLDTAKERTDGDYAFVCEKCASVFGYYGYFLYKNQLEERARRIYEGT